MLRATGRRDRQQPRVDARIPKMDVGLVFLSCCAGSLNYSPLQSVIIPSQLVRTEEFESEFAYANYSRRTGSVIPQHTGNDALHR